MYKPRCYGVIARSAERATRQSLYKKVRFVFGRDCRVALRAPRNKSNDRQQCGLYTPRKKGA
ncbi:MAG: hypothetical protein LBL66_01290 [Clostridiales bacterium]|nr:hypothetical protein [Clostridiales bacterium]